jgi:molybdate transport system ATP-binding protein
MTDIIDVAFRGTLGRFTLDAAFAVPARGVSALFGPSGCGKTSVLRCMAGLQGLDGHCTIAGEVWQEGSRFVPTHRRPLGYVFQEASLFPHLSVRRNLLYGAPRDPEEFGEVTDLLGLVRLLDRAPAHLSGGERQRVAIGRALLSRPRLLLMDEPLSALDRQTRDEILPYLERLHETLSLPVIYISHDMSEVERLADHLVLMKDGRVRASGPLRDLQSDPALPLARAQDAAMSLDGVVTGFDSGFGLLELEVAGGRFTVPAAAAPIGARRRIRVLASDVSLACERPGPSTILNTLSARIVSASDAGPNEVVAVLALGGDDGARLLSRISRRSWVGLGLEPGAEVFAQVKGVALKPGDGDQSRE